MPCPWRTCVLQGGAGASLGEGSAALPLPAPGCVWPSHSLWSCILPSGHSHRPARGPDCWPGHSLVIRTDWDSRCRGQGAWGGNEARKGQTLSAAEGRQSWDPSLSTTPGGHAAALCQTQEGVSWLRTGPSQPLSRAERSLEVGLGSRGSPLGSPFHPQAAHGLGGCLCRQCGRDTQHSNLGPQPPPGRWWPAPRCRAAELASILGLQGAGRQCTGSGPSRSPESPPDPHSEARPLRSPET